MLIKKKIRLRKEYRVRFWLFIVITLVLIYFIPERNRLFLRNFFGTRCINYQQIYSKKLNDFVVDYLQSAKLNGIEVCKTEDDIRKRVKKGELVRIRNNRFFVVDNLNHSYPYLTADGKKLLKEIGRRFRKKTGKEGFKGTRFIITSMTRTSKMIKALGRVNNNVSENSPHLFGNAFDISYANFSIIKYKVTDCDKWYLKEALAEVIWQLRQEKKCWATYERQQGCFHVVAR